MDKNDLVSGLREGLQTKSHINGAVMPITDMVGYVDLNVHTFAGQILAQFNVTSKVGNNQLSLGELVAWCDWHLNNTVPNVVRAVGDKVRPHYDVIQDKSTGAVYAFAPGARPVFFHVRDPHHWHFLMSGRLTPGPEHLIVAERNLAEFVWGELRDRAALVDGKPDTSGMQPLIDPPPPATYTVVAGDTFTRIAAKLGVTVDALKAANPQVVDIEKIDVGQVLNVPK